MASPDVRRLPVLPERRQREPLHCAGIHGLGRRRRLRRVRSHRRALRIQDPGRVLRREAAPLFSACHRFPRPQALRAAAGRPARHLRLWGLRPPDGPGRPPRGRHGACHDTGRRRPRARPRPRLRLRTGSRRSPTGAAQRRDPVRPGRDAFLPAMAALDRGGHLAIAGIHLTDIPALNYDRHLFQERELVSVTANSRSATARSSWRSPPRYRSGPRRRNTPSIWPRTRLRTWPGTP